MSISSTAAPDLDAVCRALIGREPVSADRIGVGRNSRVFHVRLAGGSPDAPADVVVKFYRRDPGDSRDRLAGEFHGLQFLWQNGVRAIPYPIAADRDRYCAIYDYIEGEAFDEGRVAAGDIDASVRFLSELKALRHRDGSAALPVASEACFSLGAIAGSLERRLERLQASDQGGDGRELHAWLDSVLAPLVREALAWCRESAGQAGIGFDDELASGARTLSPSDFGFHNAIRRPDGSIAFVDFEYFGWDDPAKTIADFVLHPGMALPVELGQRFAARLLDAFGDVPRLADRTRIVYPLFGLKWCVILLNEFLPERRAAASRPGVQGVPGIPGIPGIDDAAAEHAKNTRAAQFRKATAMAQRIRREYRDNPVVAHP